MSTSQSRLSDRTWLECQYATRPVQEIAAELDVSASTVYRAMRNLAIRRRGRGNAARSRIGHASLQERSWLVERYASSTITEIAVDLGVSPKTVGRALDLHGIERHARQRRPDRRRPTELDDPVWLRERYSRAWSVREVAAELAVNAQMVGAALRRHGIPISSHRGSEHPRLVDPDWLGEQIMTTGSDEIADQLGVSRVGVQRAMSRYKIRSPHKYNSARYERPSKRTLQAAWRTEATLKGVARRFGVSHNTSTIWLASVGIFVSDIPTISRRDLAAAVDEGCTVDEMVRRFKVTGRTVIVELHRHDLFNTHRHRHLT